MPAAHEDSDASIHGTPTMGKASVGRGFPRSRVGLAWERRAAFIRHGSGGTFIQARSASKGMRVRRLIAGHDARLAPAGGGPGVATAWQDAMRSTRNRRFPSENDTMSCFA